MGCIKGEERPMKAKIFDIFKDGKGGGRLRIRPGCTC